LSGFAGFEWCRNQSQRNVEKSGDCVGKGEK
jgi:hypothetical protein